MELLLNVMPSDLAAYVEMAAFEYAQIALGIGGPTDLVGLIARFVVGFMFFWAGVCKLFVPVRRRIMCETLREAGIPLPVMNTWFVGANELVFGFLFMIGALTLLSGAVLAVITLVAFATVGRKKVEPGGPLFVLSGLLYNNEIMILVFIGLVAVFGPGAWSVDAVLFGALRS